MTKQHKKRCPRCHKMKLATSFGWRGKHLRSHCKECSRKAAKEYYHNNQNKVQKYKEENKEAITARKKAWKEANPDYHHQYYLRNKKRLRKKNNDYEKKRCAVDPCYKLKKNLRTRLYHALKGEAKNGSAVKDMGCTVEELKTYLESKFQSGMSWDNYGIHGWHIDHVKPLADFNLTDREELLKACHYTNLQPLWAEDNMRKNRYDTSS